MSDSGIIYSIVCKVNGKRYIGQTIQDLSKRWKDHIQESKTHSHRPLYRAINKYGVGMFTIRAIEENIKYDNLSARETYWIEQFDTFNNGYNLTTGGEQSSTIHQDVKDKISSTMSGVVKSDEHISNMRASLKKKYKTQSAFKVNGDGKHARRKIKGTHHITGEIVKFNSMKDACDELGLKSGNLSRGIKNGYRVGEYLWEKIDTRPNSYAIYGKRILDGKIIHHFDSIREAGRVLGTGGDSGIRKALKNPSRYSWKGCRWYREET